jgi:hypothetical protein
MRPVAKASTVVSVGTSSTTVVGYNPNRATLVLTNAGANIIDVQFSTTWGTVSGWALGGPQVPTAVATQGVRLQPNSAPFVLDDYTGAVAGIAQTGATALAVAEF